MKNKSVRRSDNKNVKRSGIKSGKKRSGKY
jgi:hypothetical protein